MIYALKFSPLPAQALQPINNFVQQFEAPVIRELLRKNTAFLAKEIISSRAVLKDRYVSFGEYNEIEGTFYLEDGGREKYLVIKLPLNFRGTEVPVVMRYKISADRKLGDKSWDGEIKSSNEKIGFALRNHADGHSFFFTGRDTKPVNNVY